MLEKLTIDYFCLVVYELTPGGIAQIYLYGDEVADSGCEFFARGTNRLCGVGLRVHSKIVKSLKNDIFLDISPVRLHKKTFLVYYYCSYFCHNIKTMFCDERA